MKCSKILLVPVLFLLGLAGCGLFPGKDAGKAITLEKSVGGNPITGFNQEGELIYGGDPTALVVEDTVYLYTGHDTSEDDTYVIPEYQCYSTKDMVNWTYEGVVMKAEDISWATDQVSAWAAQVAKYVDPVTQTEKYYLYYCSWDRTSAGKQSIGVAVSDTPTGPFVDSGQPLVRGSFTKNQTSRWNDIDPTIWIESDSEGIEHRYLMWGNSKNYICELNEDMISIKDLDQDGEIVFGSDVIEKKLPDSYSEAPWIYRRSDESGNYIGEYYLFYAYGWREQMAYTTTDDLLKGDYQTSQVIMPATATSNTNHMSVIDFKGETYFIYHNGSLPGGSGFRRVVCIEKLQFNEDGSISMLTETASGLTGITSTITDLKNQKVGHTGYVNSLEDKKYPYHKVKIGTDPKNAKSEDFLWELVPGKADSSNETYVSIEAYNKPGLYITVNEDSVGLSQDDKNEKSKEQTFISQGGLSGEGVSFESVSLPGQYLAVIDGELVLTNKSEKKAASFLIE